MLLFLLIDMHFTHGEIPAEYSRYIGFKRLVIFFSVLLLGSALLVSVSLGAAYVPVGAVLKSIIGLNVPGSYEIIVWNIRLPQALAAIVAGAGLATGGAVMQSILRNPLGSPFTLGISHAAAFGAALSVMMFDQGTMTPSDTVPAVITNPYITTATAFIFSMLVAVIIIGVSRKRGCTPEVMILTGVALGSLFTAGTMFLQYFADDTQLAAMVFWTFGDTSRASWSELCIISAVTASCCLYFFCNGWNYNTIDSGDETAKSLGVRVERVRLLGMLAASLLTAVIIGFLGVVGFVGLIVPHMIRRIIGADYRYLLPASFLGGGVLLLLSDTVARLALSPHVLPVSVLTAFMGAPAFIYLILRGKRL